jgi:hypothetical protein
MKAVGAIDELGALVTIDPTIIYIRKTSYLGREVKKNSQTQRRDVSILSTIAHRAQDRSRSVLH